MISNHFLLTFLPGAPQNNQPEQLSIKEVITKLRIHIHIVLSHGSTREGQDIFPVTLSLIKRNPPQQ